MTPTPLPLLEATIDRVENAIAVLRLTDGQELRVPSHLLPDTHVGVRVTLSLLVNAEADAARNAQARSVLNELLKE